MGNGPERWAVLVYLAVILAFVWRGWVLEHRFRKEQWVRYQLVEELRLFGVIAEVDIYRPSLKEVNFFYPPDHFLDEGVRNYLKGLDSDSDRMRVWRWYTGRSPAYEPSLEELLRLRNDLADSYMDRARAEQLVQEALSSHVEAERVAIEREMLGPVADEVLEEQALQRLEVAVIGLEEALREAHIPVEEEEPPPQIDSNLTG